MSIALVERNETELIVRGKFPKRDETAFDREAGKMTAGAGGMTDLQVQMVAASGFTADEFHGQTGNAVLKKLIGHHAQFGTDSADFTAAAGWLTLAGQNVKTTKEAINAVVIRYHDDYEATHQRVKDEHRPQKELADAKNELVAAAQAEVDKLWDTYQARHTAIRTGLDKGTAPPAELSAIRADAAPRTV